MQSGFVSRSPANGEVFGSYQLHTTNEIELALERSFAAHVALKNSGIDTRVSWLNALANQFEQRKPQLSELITSEMGKPIGEAEAEIQKCAATCRIVAEKGPHWLESEFVESPARISKINFEPLGPVLGIMPWNFPFWQVVRYLVPGILAGNSSVVKHAENVPGCAEELERIFANAGLPDGTLVNLRVAHTEVPNIIADQRIRCVTVTGSVRAGRQIAAIAGAHGKKCVLELGGSDPFVVFGDTDVEAAAAAAVTARFANTGQSCVCAKRILVESSLLSDFTEAFVERVRTLKFGDPMNRAHLLGPIARKDLRETLFEQVQRCNSNGAKELLSGGPDDGPGYYFSPIVLADDHEGSVAAKEELFGPVAPIFSFKTEDEAVLFANDSEFGLAAAVWTADMDRAARMERQLDAGAVFINDVVKSDAHVSFGGIKASGYGRELGKMGIREFTNAKTVWMS